MTKTDETRAALNELSPDECIRLLGDQSVGRLAVAFPGEPPTVVPVNYLIEGDVIVFRSDLGQKLTRLRQQPVAFELDHIDYVHRTGWSVLVQGVAYEATHFETDHLALHPWAEGEKSHWVRIVPSSITGRRLVLPEWPRSSRGYL
ncbi:MAG TPA: pyridoxamine 5'-phosphate oxidase family protein [Acidimicrobiales bacterium]|nr:pyridoxamine 5'-phosphate oxidase family protein [Acidimicrobiales bacterium]